MKYLTVLGLLLLAVGCSTKPILDTSIDESYTPNRLQKIHPISVIDGVETYIGYIQVDPPSRSSQASMEHGGMYRLGANPEGDPRLNISYESWGQAKKFVGKRVVITGTIVGGKGGPYLVAEEYRLAKDFNLKNLEQ
ncbi:MAG: hypothetical protein JXR40_00390 [Pontiellaceae bacterium]|nr:hypothetical protein [Pontiellaceae bacterium]